MQQLLTKYPKAGYLCAGDRNKMDTQAIEDALPKCKQIVTKYTYKKRKIHDVMLTNMSHLFALPFIAPAVQVDFPGKGVPSDHDMAVAVPLAGAGAGAVTREYTVRTSRPMPDSAIRQFGQWITGEDWAEVKSVASTSQQGLVLKKILQDQIDQTFPKKQVKISNTDKPWITSEIKKLDRWKKSEYRKHGKSVKYQSLLKSYNEKYRSAAGQHLRRNVTDLMEAAPGQAWSVLKRMGARPGECGEEAAFSMTEHVEKNLSVDESLEKMVSYFSGLSCQHPAMDVELLPARVRTKLMTAADTADIPVITPYDVWQIQQGRHKTNSCVPGDLPPRLRYEFQVELCEPAAAIFNNITRTGEWVEDWKQEFGTPLKKVPVPANEESLRIIAITNHFSLIYERFVLKWVLQYIEDKLDPDQFGGQKGHSVAHYLIEVQNAILYNQDLGKPYATLLAAIDISKGFNLIAHNEVITRISDMGCPGWLTKILISYLSGRTLQIRWQEKISRKMPLNSGSGQGTIIGLLFFVIIFNGAGPKPPLEKIGVSLTQTRKKGNHLNQEKRSGLMTVL